MGTFSTTTGFAFSPQGFSLQTLIPGSSMGPATLPINASPLAPASFMTHATDAFVQNAGQSPFAGSSAFPHITSTPLPHMRLFAGNAPTPGEIAARPISREDLSVESAPTPLILHSSDEELIGRAARPWEDRVPLIPPSIAAFPESREMWAFLQKPTHDLARLTQRQRLLRTLIAIENLPQLFQAKDGAYRIHQAIGSLFQLVPIDDYGHKMPLLQAYRNDMAPEYEEHVFQALKDITEGKRALGQTIELLKQIDPELFQAYASTLAEHLEAIDFMQDDYFLHQDYDQNRSQAHTQELMQDLKPLGMFISFAELARRDGYTQATFDPSQPFTYRNGWSLIREKDAQTPNRSPEDRALTILSGSNMSGKSFHLKQNLMMQLLAQSFGFVPCDAGNFQLFDSIAYLDRASTQPAYNLSAFGQEISDWKEALAKLGGRPLLFVDEGFSTTAPEDQYRLLAAVSTSLSRGGARMMLASHNEHFIEHLRDDPGTGIYHFQTEIGTDGDIRYRYELTPGPDDSRALDVAANMGLQPALMQRARAFLEGQPEIPTKSKRPAWHAAVPMTAAKRAAQKNEAQSIGTLFANHDKHPLVHLFSEDEHFQSNWYRGSDIVTGETDGDIRFGGWRFEGMTARRARLLKMIIGAGNLTPAETLERQQLFAELAAHDQYPTIRRHCEALVWQLKFLPRMQEALSHGLFFNLAVNPFANFRPIDSLEDQDLLMVYLRLNKKLLGDAFPLDETMTRIQGMRQAIAMYEDVRAHQDIEEIEAISSREGDELVPDDVAQDFLQLALDEPHQEQWNGRVTRRRIRTSSEWMEHHRYDRWYLVNKLFKEKDEDTYSYREPRYKEITPELAARFLEIAQDEPNTERWEGEVTEERIKAYESWTFRQGSDREDRLRQILRSNALSPYGHFNFDATDLREKFLTLSAGITAGAATDEPITIARVQAVINALKRETSDARGEHAADAEATESIKAILDAMDPESEVKDLHRGHIDALEILIMQLRRAQSEIGIDDSEIKRAFNAAAGLDPDTRVTLDLMRMRLDQETGEMRRSLERLPARSLFDANLKELEPELRAIIAAAKEDHRKGDYDYYNQWPTELLLLINLEMILDGQDPAAELTAWMRSQESVHLHQSALHLEELLGKIVGGRSPGALFAALRNLSETSIHEDYEAYLREEEGYGGKLTSDDVAAHLRARRREIDKAFRKETDQLFPFTYSDDIKPIVAEVTDISTVALFGHMINTMGFASVDFNAEGTLHFEEMWNLVKAPDAQVRNSASFDAQNAQQLITGANMSGKTFYLKALTFAVACAQATGFAPARAASSPFFQNIVYLDRVTAKSDRNLSAFGNEVTYWKAFLKLLKGRSPTFAAVDEAFSTTSPLYQSALTYAVGMEMRDRGQLLALASHSHDALDALPLGAWHFATHVDAEGQISFDYRMEPGHEASQAIAVARKLGLPEEILELAESLVPSR